MADKQDITGQLAGIPTECRTCLLDTNALASWRSDFQLVMYCVYVKGKVLGWVGRGLFRDLTELYMMGMVKSSGVDRICTALDFLLF